MVYIQDPLHNSEVDIQEIIDIIEIITPSHIYEEIDLILIGEDERLYERELEALYESGAIYILNSLFTNNDYVENVIHETAHSLEKKYGMVIYSDRMLEKEFLGKRRRFYHKLKALGYDVNLRNFENSEYEEGFDSFLYKDIGYEKLTNILNGLFVSPYASTSLEEYFANGFEKYFLDDRDYLLKVSPILYRKIVEIIEYE